MTDLPTRAVDRYDNEVWTARWDGDVLHHATLYSPTREEIELVPRCGIHPVFGAVDELRDISGEPRGRLAAVAWSAPEFIPPLDDPSALIAGAGPAVLGWLAWLARRAGRETLRYRGPYPTAALLGTLLGCFEVRGDEQDAADRFTANVELTAVRGEMKEVPVDFAPTPPQWHWPRPGLCVALRDGLQRAYIEGRAYPSGPRRLRPEGDGYVACVEIAGERWAEVLALDADGEPRGEPQPLPPAAPHLVGDEVPSEITNVLAIVLGTRAPALLASSIQVELATRTIRWGDTGDTLARTARDGAIELHAELGDRLPEHSSDEILTLLVDAVEPLASRLAQRRLAASAKVSGPAGS